MRWMTALIAAVCAMSMAAAAAEDQSAKKQRLLFLSKSEGFEHDVIKQKKGKPSTVDKALTALAEKNNWEITCTKDASLVNPEGLKNFDVVIFYTTGDLTKPSKDGGAAMPENGLDALFGWIKGGGGFVGYHSATDTFHGAGGEVHPYIQMIGGEFDTHGQQFKGRLKPVSPGHPAMEGMPADWVVADEWYINKNINTADMHVLTLLELGEERANQPEKYNIPDYPIIWCRGFGDGRVLYNGMGHRDDVWESEDFQKVVTSNILWASGRGELQADPNYEAVVPKTIPGK